MPHWNPYAKKLNISKEVNCNFHAECGYAGKSALDRPVYNFLKSCTE